MLDSRRQSRQDKAQKADATSQPKSKKQSFQGVVLEGVSGPVGEEVLVEALMHRYSNTLISATLLGWHWLVRQSHYDAKRLAMRSGLVWSNPERAGALMAARATLLETERLSWFAVSVTGRSMQKDVRSAFPLSTLPRLRIHTSDDFGRVAERLRQQIHDLVQAQRDRLAERERVVVERWISREKAIKDVQKLKRQDEEANRRLEVAKQQLARAPDYLELAERLYLTCVVRSVENAATFLSQIFSDKNLLQIRLMAVPWCCRTQSRFRCTCT